MYRRIITRARTSCLVTSSRNGAIEYEKDPAFIDYCLLLIAGVLLPFAPKRFGERRLARPLLHPIRGRVDHACLSGHDRLGDQEARLGQVRHGVHGEEWGADSGSRQAQGA